MIVLVKLVFHVLDHVILVRHAFHVMLLVKLVKRVLVDVKDVINVSTVMVQVQ